MNVNEITVTQGNTVAEAVDFKAKAQEYLKSQGNKLPEKHLAQFLELAQSFQLNPFKREIYAIGYADKWNIVTGFEVYLKRAERSGLLDGWDVEDSGSVEKGDLKATITIYRKDRKYPFKHTVYYKEVVQKNKEGNPNSIWEKTPVYMTKKVAMSQGFRLCFPDELAGMPYVEDEMPRAEEPRNVTPKAEEPKKEDDSKYKMNKAQSQLMREMFADDVFSEDEKQTYRNILAQHSLTAVELLDNVTETYNARKNATPVDLVSQAFDGTVSTDGKIIF